MTPQIRLAYRPPNATPLPYTASPLKLLWEDLRLVIRYAWALPLVFFPLRLGKTARLDELHPSTRNGISIGTQGFLAVFQVFFLLSIPFTVIFMVPALWILLYITVALTLNYVICIVVLNGYRRVFVSQVPIAEQPAHTHEHWFFINGIAGSHSWMQDNLDQLSYTFGRRITGIHNRTSGIIFDLIECLIQRCFTYATADIRQAYPLIKKALLDPDSEKVVLILHSQGGIEGGLVIDWLLDELPQPILEHLEVYTFANAANHFNNPRLTFGTKQNGTDSSRLPSRYQYSVGHIEHYVNSADMVSRIGVLHFITIPNRYMGRLFIRAGSGHLLNQHYLDTMFTLGPDHKVLENNPFMDLEVETKSDCTPHDNCEDTLLPISATGLLQENPPPKLRVKDYSRLWHYRNGGLPSDKID
ncbi:uncharacterized protein N7484_002576 [Penicillium longicatenatum]|uniref:uncharacterized protein n=1 Tax=Penicillium longicatenatum TaxID=1561947 RepID=UPI0025494285|nr:uncharacterized protein N7484_002576 [Penicillium longicatenatum]KAJ5648853.1 hypothetical protein N7484_002576 [Penicillium longicatenatum]